MVASLEQHAAFAPDAFVQLEQLDQLDHLVAGPEPVVVVLDDARVQQVIADLRWHLDELLPAGSQSLVVDVSGLSRLSSQSLAALLFALRRCRSRGGQLHLVGANRRCRELLARTGLSGVFALGSALHF